MSVVILRSLNLVETIVSCEDYSNTEDLAGKKLISIEIALHNGRTNISRDPLVSSLFHYIKD